MVGDVIAALERRLNPPSKQREWATFTEVTDGLQRRRVDLLAVNMWINRGRRILGYEIKVKREDWMRELRSPKADSWFSVANQWYLVAPQGVAHLAEIPSTWGFLELRRAPKGWKLFEKVPAPTLVPAEESPWWLIQRLLARVEDVRKAAPAEIEEARQEGYQSGLARGKADAEIDTRWNSPEQVELRELLDALGPGVPWRKNERVPAVAKALALLNTPGQVEAQAERTAKRFRFVAEVIERTLRDEPLPDDDLF